MISVRNRSVVSWVNVIVRYIAFTSQTIKGLSDIPQLKRSSCHVALHVPIFWMIKFVSFSHTYPGLAGIVPLFGVTCPLSIRYPHAWGFSSLLPRTTLIPRLVNPDKNKMLYENTFFQFCM